MTFSPSYHHSTSDLVRDHKYLATVLQLAELALSAKTEMEGVPTPKYKSLSLFLDIKNAEEKVFNVFDGYCLDGFAPQIRHAIDHEGLEMSDLEYQVHALRFAVNEIYEELKKRG